MAYTLTPGADRIAAALRAHGQLTSRELHELTGVTGNNQATRLALLVASGTVAVKVVRVPTGTGNRTVRINRYTWCGGEHNPTPASGAPLAPNQRSMRRCLADGCGQMFLSSSAANRICPRCKASAEHAASRCGLFDTPHVVLNP